MMDPTTFYGRKKSVQVREIPAFSDDSELSTEEDDIDVDESWNPDSSSEDSAESSDDTDTEETDKPESSSDIRADRNLLWRHRKVEDVVTKEPEFTGLLRQGEEPKQPVEYFRNIIDANIIKTIVLESNRYSVQKDVTKPLQLSADELEQFIGIVFMMSIIKMPRARYYWGPSSRCDTIASVMSNKRFEEMKSNIHCNDNSIQHEQPHDKLFKVRPLVDAFKQKVNDERTSEKLCIDEQVLPFKGKSSLRQYNPKKPKKWGYKIFVCSGITGIIHDFEIYTGRIDPCPNQPDIGASGNIVLRLLQTVPRNVWHKVYFDNWFTSPSLQVTLHKQGIASIGTVRINRVKGCKMPSDKELVKQGRGTSIVKTGNIDGVDVIVTRWMDNKAVTLLSTYAAAEPVSEVRRWDRKRKEDVMITCPSAVQLYNKFMGGVDLLDALLALYRNPIRSKKWYHRIIFHFFDMAVVQAWLIYKLDCEQEGLDRKKIIPLLDFKLQVAQCLMKENKSEARKRGRPSLEMETQLQLKKKRGPTAPVPPLPIRTDNIGHYPTPLNEKGRCKRPGCSGFSRMKCEKCNLYLCLTQKSNCFKEFHQP